jgi:transposase-like protein
VLEEFYEHLNKHSKEEVEVLKKLVELELRNPLAYEELEEMLREFDYEVWRKNVAGGNNFQEGEKH